MVAFFRSQSQFMQKFTYLTLTTLIISACVVNVLSQESDKTTSPPSFPSNFLGDNPVLIYKLLYPYKARLRKSKFETTDNFRTRVANLVAKMRLSGTKTAADSFTFVSTDFEENYNADLNKFALTLSSESDPSFSDEERTLNDIIYPPLNNPKSTTVKESAMALKLADGRIRLLDNFDTSRESPDTNKARFSTWLTLELRSDSRQLGTAIGQNAFGVKRRYRIKTYSSLSLSMYGPNLSIVDKSLSFSIKPEDARAVSGKLALAVTGRLRYPFFVTNNSSNEATLTDPEEVHYFNYFLLFEPTEISIFDIRTGRIFKEFDLRPRETAAPAPPTRTTIVESINSTPIPKVFSDVRIISKPRPGYTDSARQANLQGTVILSVTFLASGHVGSISPIKGLGNGLTEQAIGAARRILFEPAKENDVPVTITKIIDYPFSIY